MEDFCEWVDLRRDAATETGILESRFWQMTPAELDDRQEIQRRKEAREWERAAWMVSWILAAWVKDPPSKDELLGRMTVRR